MSCTAHHPQPSATKNRVTQPTHTFSTHIIHISTTTSSHLIRVRRIPLQRMTRHRRNTKSVLTRTNLRSHLRTRTPIETILQKHQIQHRLPIQISAHLQRLRTTTKLLIILNRIRQPLLAIRTQTRHLRATHKPIPFKRLAVYPRCASSLPCHSPSSLPNEPCMRYATAHD